MKFTNEPVDSPIRKRAENGKGVYGVKIFDFDRPLGSQLVPDSEAAIDPDVLLSETQIGWASSYPCPPHALCREIAKKCAKLFFGVVAAHKKELTLTEVTQSDRTYTNSSKIFEEFHS